MIDVFVSYAQEDRVRAGMLVEVLESAGYSVFWDVSLRVGEDFASTISDALDESRCVIVLWSENSIGSDWVMDEAHYGKEKMSLLPVCIDPVVPLGFRALHTVDLTRWNGSRDHPGIQQTLAAVAKMVQVRPAQDIDFYSVFIVYGSGDGSFARRLYDQLEGFGIRASLDERRPPVEDILLSPIDRGIRVYDKVLLCCSKSSLSRPWVEREVINALQKEQQLWREREKKSLTLIPLDLDGYVFDGWESGMQSEVTRRHVADFKGWEDNATFEAAFEKLVKALRADAFVREPDPESKL